MALDLSQLKRIAATHASNIDVNPQYRSNIPMGNVADLNQLEYYTINILRDTAQNGTVHSISTALLNSTQAHKLACNTGTSCTLNMRCTCYQFSAKSIQPNTPMESGCVLISSGGYE